MIPFETEILIVDDIASMRKMIRLVLDQAGFKNIHEAKDGADAWKIIEAGKPKIGLIISDWMMPGTTGFDLLKRVRGNENAKSTLFIMLTAEVESHVVKEAVLAGVDQYMVKPFSKTVLFEKLALLKDKKI